MQKATPLLLAGSLAAATWITLGANHAAAAPTLTAPATKTTTTPATPATPWAHQSSDIKPDAKAVFGTLPNGFRYIIFPNAEPPGRVSLRLHIATGSLMEADDQQGLAHFMEHMVFNGTKHYKEDELVPIMQRKGIAFGAHANAYTSFDETVYMFDLPDVNADTLDLGFGVMRDQADGALLAPEEIEKERGVILSEKTSRDSVSYRLMQQQFNELLPGSLIARRFPIGEADVIAKAPRERFVDYYSRYYTPDRMTFVVVGDVDPKVIAKRIEAQFGSMVKPANAGKNPDLGVIKPGEALQASVFSDPEVSSTEVGITTVKPYKLEPDTSAKRIADMPLAVANAIIDRRFQRIAKKEGSVIAKGGAGHDVLFNHAELGSIEVTAADDKWQEALPVMEQEFRRAMQFGFNKTELAEIKANILNAAEQEVKAAATRKSDDLATAIAKSVNDFSVLTSPETDLEITKRALDALTPEACHTAFKKFWEGAPLRLTLTTKAAGAEAKTTLTSLFKSSQATAVQADADRNTSAFGYESFGAAGTIAKTSEIADLGITQWILGNNVRVNFKKTDFDKNAIGIVARIGNGKLAMPQDKPGLDLFAGAVFDAGGLGKHSDDDLQQILAGRNVGTKFAVGSDAFVLSGSTTPEDLKLEMQLLCAQITDPGYRDEGLRQFRKALPMIDQQLKHSPSGPMKDFSAFLHGNDPRFVMPPIATLGKYEMADAKAWLTPELANGYLELSIVGDIDAKAVQDAVLATFGALPARASTKNIADSLRQVKFPAPFTKTYTYETKIPQGISSVLWQTRGVRNNYKEMRRLNLLADIYGDRLREELREKLGATYSPSADAGGDDSLINFGFLKGTSIGKPEDVDKIGKLMRDIGDKLAKEGATQDELERARKPLLSQLDNTLRENSYWLGNVLAESQENPERIEIARSRKADYESIKIEEINKLAKEYLKAENASVIGIKPQ